MDILQDKKLGRKVHNWLTIAYWNKILLLLYIFTMPFVSAFSFTGTLSMPLFLVVFLFMLMGIEVISSGKLPPGFIGFDLLLICLFLLLVIFSYATNGLGNSKALNHAIAYTSTFLLFYITVKFVFFITENKNLLIRQVLQFLSFTTIVSAAFSNAEFILNNFFGFDVNEYIHRPLEGEEFYNPMVVGLFVRARGFATESGHFTLMMELFSPLVVYYMYFSGFCKWHAALKVLFVISIFFSFVFAASSASFVIIPVAIALAGLVHLKKIYFYVRRNPSGILIASTIATFIILVFNYFFSLSALVLLSVTDKLDSSSMDDLQSRIDFFYNTFTGFDFIKKLSGAGPAGHEILGYEQSILSLYYSIPFELGFLGLLLIVLLFLYFIACTLKIKTKIGFFLLLSVISGVIHYYFISNFWYPWFWFIAAFAVFCGKKEIFK